MQWHGFMFVLIGEQDEISSVVGPGKKKQGRGFSRFHRQQQFLHGQHTYNEGRKKHPFISTTGEGRGRKEGRREGRGCTIYSTHVTIRTITLHVCRSRGNELGVNLYAGVWWKQGLLPTRNIYPTQMCYISRRIQQTHWTRLEYLKVVWI